MPLFSAKCDRCGTRTHNKSDKRVICEACVKEMALIVEASKEETRPCPIDGAAMVKELTHMLVIDRCPQCKGVWLDGGELEKLKNDVEGEAMLAVALKFNTPFT